MNKEYKRIEQLITELKASGKVRFTASEFRYYSESVNNTQMAELGELEIESSIIAFYKQIDFIDLNWYANDDAALKYIDEDTDTVGGSLHVAGLSAVINAILKKNSKEIIDPHKVLSEKDHQSLGLYIPFDMLNGDGAVCFKLENDMLKDELHLVSTGLSGFIKPLHTNCATYMEKGFSWYYFNGWQQACFLKDKEIKQHVDFYLQQIKMN